MQLYLDALRLLEEATEKLEGAGDTLVLAHLELPMSLIRERVTGRMSNENLH